MNGLGLGFVIMPCIGATIMAALLWDWRLVVAAAFGGLGIIALGEYLPEALRVISLPIVVGVVIGAVSLTPRLFTRPSIDIWSRMLWALVPTFVISFLFLLINTSGA
ncbi:hypothetical protein [Octadecabacter ascidiaceicola]|uniref:Uncharacterized protein n=1 Tax=Octadecabacter ascidiaceicola TaxID=1655543 RepID=A0A238KLY2_9RHOB|nr:hypothetical protein [Octadecabacter ascidiaceicola]SMX43700.1 hypothetical protein OCA8868_03022 [Octadecabacter ascidiaceicola]